MTALVASILLPFFTGLIGLKYNFPKDMLISEEEFFGKNKWQRLNKKGKWYVFFTLIVLIITEIGLISASIDNKKDTIKTESKTVYVPKIVYVPQHTKDSLIKTEKANVQEHPFVFLKNISFKMPTQNSKDTAKLKSTFCNQTTYNAYGLKIRLYFYIEENFRPKTIFYNDAIVDYTLPSGYCYDSHLPIKISGNLLPTDTLFFYIVGNYENSKKAIREVRFWEPQKDSVFFADTELSKKVMTLIKSQKAVKF